MATRLSSQHSPLAAFKEQPNCSVQQGLNPLLKKGHQVTYKMPLTPGQLWCSENSGLGRIDIFLFKKGNKDSGCHGRIHLHSILVCLSGRRQPLPGPPPPPGLCSPQCTEQLDGFHICALNRTDTYSYRFLNGINLTPFSTFLKLGTIVRNDILQTHRYRLCY